MKVKKLTIVTVIIISCMSMVSCGKKSNDVIEETSSKLKETDSVDIDISISVNANVNTEGKEPLVPMDASGTIVLTFNKIKTESLAKIEGEIVTHMLDLEKNTNIITYMQQDSDNITYYSVNKDTGKWEKFKQKVNSSNDGPLSKIFDNYKNNMTLSKEKQSVNDVECYVLKGTLSKEETEKLSGKISEEIKLQHVGYTIYVDTKECNIQKIEFHHIEDKSTDKKYIEKFELIMLFNNQNDEKEIVIPEKAKKTENIVYTSPFD